MDGSQNTTARQRVPMNDIWLFARIPEELVSFERPPDEWETVVLPHTPRIEPDVVQYPFQGLCWYRRTIDANPKWNGKRIGLEFGAAMQIADVWVNGMHVLRHLGGYLPFTIDLSEILGAGHDAEVTLCLDNRDTELCPPGKPLAEMDFSYFGGLYREVHLVVTNSLHVSDPVCANQEAGGGVFIRTESLSHEKAILSIKTHVHNAAIWPARKCRIISTIVGPEGGTVGTWESLSLMVAAGEGHHFHQAVEIICPLAWHPDTPHLYRLVTEVYTGTELTDRYETKFGIRRLGLGNRFCLNGEEFPIRGTNRHQDHPYVGNAIPPNAQRRDARRIKDTGFNLVRLSHYPQDPSFLDECDELGLLVQAAVPGWQQFWFNPSFVRQSFRDIRELVRRDRNHPSIVFWEPNLNETGVGESGEGHADWCRAAHEITHAEYPGDQCFTFGDDYPEKPGWDWDVRGFVREYGDFAYGGNESTSRHHRGEGEAALLQQAWNYQWTLNHLNAAFRDPQKPYIGCATWVMFDYNRGYHPDSCNCGAMDIFRLPKYVLYLFQSQRDPRGQDGPMVFLSTDWKSRACETKVVVYSNCDEVELFLNGASLGRRKPDAGPDTAYSTDRRTSLATVGDNYDRSGGNPFDGGNANHIPHPPFTFAGVKYEAGDIKAIGYLDGEARAQATVRTPGASARILVEANLQGIPLSAAGQDLVFLHATIVDAEGAPTGEQGRPVFFELEGKGELIGENPTRSESGIATILLRTWNYAAPLSVRARAEGIDSGYCELGGE